MTYIQDLHAPLFVYLHDVGDQVIPVGESRRLQAALKGRSGVHYTEMNFSHLDPVKGKLPFLKLMREFWKFFGAVYPIFWQASGKSQGRADNPSRVVGNREIHREGTEAFPYKLTRYKFRRAGRLHRLRDKTAHRG